MTTDRNQQILGLIERLSNDARLAQEHALDDTARLLAMALLDLQTKLRSISPRELRSFTRTVANVVDLKIGAPRSGAIHGETGGSSQNGRRPFVD
jgi:hypothetical protein